eukprot:snap_masked-scaffold_34-processed-gene-3.54-mRNA-1 protein AED:0.08 eAED:1.00 QI:0/0/0/1/1/1/2/0/330
MGNCFSASEEYKTYARGQDPDQTRLPYSNTYQQTPASNGSSPRLSVSNASQFSFSSQVNGSKINSMQKELEAMKRRLDFLEKVREAVQEVNEEIDDDSVNSDDENLEYQRKFREELNVEKRQLKRLQNFELQRLQRKSIARGMNNNLISSVRSSLKQAAPLNFSQPLPGELSRAWKNFFAARLFLMLRFYGWEEIPLEFFVDKQLVTSTIGQVSIFREPLRAKILEKRSVEELVKKRRLRQSLARKEVKGKESLQLDVTAEDLHEIVHSEDEERRSKKPHRTKAIAVGNETIEIDLSSSSSEDDSDLESAPVEMDSDVEYDSLGLRKIKH